MSTAHNAAESRPMFFLRADEAFLDRQRLTDCCGAMSSYMDTPDTGQRLCCKRCYCEVPIGQGDGASFLALDGATLLRGPVTGERNAELGTVGDRPVEWLKAR